MIEKQTRVEVGINLIDQINKFNMIGNIRITNISVKSGLCHPSGLI